MPIVTKNTGTFAKGSKGTFTLDKNALAALPEVSADAYFSNMANWKRVVIGFISTSGNQKERVEFDATLASPTGSFLTSTRSLNSFNVHYILIEDFDRGTFPIRRSSLPTAQFDLTLDPPVGSLPPALLWDTINNASAIASTGLGELHRIDSGNQLGTNPIAYNSVKKSGDFTFSGVYKHGVGPQTRQSLVGLSKVVPTGYGVQQAGYGIIFQDGNIAHIWDASSANVTLVDGQSYNFEIKRVGSIVTYKIDTTVLGTFSVGPEDVYLTACMQVGLNQIVSASFVAAPVSTPVVGRYVGLKFTATDKTYGSNVVVTEIQVIQGGVAKTFSSIGASLNNYSNLTGPNQVNMSDGNLTTSGQYISGFITPMDFVIDLGSSKTIDGIAIALSGFTGADGMEHVPTSIDILAHDTQFNSGSMTKVATKTFVRSDFTANTLKNIVP